jgi:hypothetical protein
VSQITLRAWTVSCRTTHGKGAALEDIIDDMYSIRNIIASVSISVSGITTRWQGTSLENVIHDSHRVGDVILTILIDISRNNATECLLLVP